MSSLFNDKIALGPVATGQISRGPRTGFAENLQATFDEFRTSNISVASGVAMVAAVDERKKRIEKLTGKSFDDAIQPFREAGPDEPVDELGLEENPHAEEQAVTRFRQSLPTPDKQGSILTAPQLERRAREIAVDRAAQAADVAARSSGIGAGAGRFAGAFGAALTDPFILATLPVGAAADTTILGAIAIESAIAAGSEALIQPAIQKWRARLGLEHGFGQALQNIAFAGLFGAAATAGLRGLGAGFARLPARAKVRAFDDFVPDPTPDQRGVRDRLEAEAAFEDSNVLADTPAGRQLHVERSAEARRALEQEGGPPVLDELPGELVPPPRDTIGVDPGTARAGTSGEVFSMEPQRLTVDAPRFQFKSGGNADGVTTALAGVDRWDPTKAGLILAWEDVDGRLFVSDGHQRVDLAQRLTAAGDDSIRLNVMVVREADGISAADARTLAPATNIAQGTGTAIDAAKVLRQRPDAALGLPPASALVRDAGGLARLSDDAFTMVVNERLPAAQAALAGRLAPDTPEIHVQILDTLIETKPQNAIEAESIVRDVLSAPAVREVQIDLFGSAETTVILFKERAKVLSAAAARLKKDRSAFSLLVREEGRITEEGNVLARERNQTRASEDGKILETLQRLARRKGPVADALARAAKDLKSGKRQSEVTGRFIDDVRRTAATQRGDGSGVRPGRRAGEGNTDAGTDRPGRGAGEPAGAQDLAPPATPDAQAEARARVADFIERQPERTLDEIYEVAPAHQAELERVGDEIASATGAEFKTPGLKTRAATEDKVTRRSYTSTRQLTDVVRGGFIPQTPEIAEQIATRLAQRFEIIDRGWTVTPLGYFDRKIMVRFSDGTVGELQIWQRDLFDAKAERGTALYNEGRAPGTSAARKQELTEQSVELYSAALVRAGPDWLALSKRSGSGGTSGNIKRNVSSSTTAPDTPTSIISTGDQGAPLSRTATAKPPEITAGRVSQSTNVRGEVTRDTSNSNIVGRESAGKGGNDEILDPERIAQADALERDVRAVIETDGDFDVPTRVRETADGAAVADTRTASDLLDELDADRAFSEQLGLCLK